MDNTVFQSRKTFTQFSGGGSRSAVVGHPLAITNERANDGAKYALTFLKYEQKRPTCLATTV